MTTKPYVWRTALIAAFVGLAGAAFAATAAVDPYDQSGVPIEKQPTDASLTKIVLVAGHASHGPREHEFFAGIALLMKLLQETPGVFPVLARDGWPKHPEETFKNAKAVVFYMDGGSGHPILVPRAHGGVEKADGRTRSALSISITPWSIPSNTPTRF